MKALQRPLAPLILIGTVPYLQYYGVYSLNEAHRAAILLSLSMAFTLYVLAKAFKSWSISGLIGIILSLTILVFYREPLFPALISTLVLIVTIIERKIAYDKINIIANVLSLVLLLGTLSSLVLTNYGSRHLIQTSTDHLRPIALNQVPSIVHITLDGYGSSKTLSEVYGYSNKGFVTALKDLDFQVRPNVTAPFNQTLFVMSSIMSGGYINLPKSTDNINAYRLDLGHTATNGPVQSILQDAGYNFGYSTSGYAYLDYKNAQRVTPNHWGLTGFEADLLSFYPAFLADHHNRTLKAALNESNLSQLQSPYFYYQHLLAPHPPFTLTAEGKDRPTKSVLLVDGSHAIKGSPEKRARYIKGYNQKIRFVERALIKQIKSIPKDAPIIIMLHGDHGPGAYFDQESLSKTCPAERLTTFFAIYSNLPEVREAFNKLEGTEFNLVNIYRTIFSALSTTDFAPLPNQASFLRWSAPSDSTPVERHKLEQSCQNK